MSAVITGDRVRRWSLQAFLALVFFVYYQTIGVPGTLHSWVLMGGFAITLPALIHRTALHGWRVPRDYAFIGLMGVMMVAGFVANIGGATSWQLQAYVLALVTYVFVRENVPHLPMEWFARMMLFYLLINSILMILQFWTGSFFVARGLAAGDPPLLLPSGVSDGPTKNGMLHAFALSYVFGRLVWLPKRRVYEKALVVVGIGALILSGSRAGLVAFILAAIGSAMLLPKFRPRPAGTKKRSSLKVFLLVALLLGLIGRAIVAIPDLVNRMDVNYAASVLAYKLALGDGAESNVAEGSVDTRLHQAARAGRRMRDNPLQILGVGFGAGSFEQSEGLNVHNSYVEFLYEMGLAGLLTLAALTVHVVRSALRSLPPGIVLPLLTGHMSVMAFMAFHDILRGRIFWIPLGMIAGLAFGRRGSRGNEFTDRPAAA